MKTPNSSSGRSEESLVRCGETCPRARRASTLTSMRVRRLGANTIRQLKYTEIFQGEYEAKLKAYHNSPAYQQYIQAKARGQAVVEEPQEQQISAPVNRQGKITERRIDIQVRSVD